jgi:type II secretory pathway component PulF
VLYVLLLVSAIEALYITATIEPIWKFMSDWQSVSIPAALVLVMAPVYFTACLARTYDLLPRWWNQAIARFPVLKKLLGGEA